MITIWECKPAANQEIRDQMNYENKNKVVQAAIHFILVKMNEDCLVLFGGCSIIFGSAPMASLIITDSIVFCCVALRCELFSGQLLQSMPKYLVYILWKYLVENKNYIFNFQCFGRRPYSELMNRLLNYVILYTWRIWAKW